MSGACLQDRFYDAAANARRSHRPRAAVTSNKLAAAAAAAVPSAPSSNLNRFLEATTPSVPARHLSLRTMMRGCRKTCYGEYEPDLYFNLGELWESFKEWSAYGAGVPLVLNGSDSVVQYYVPYLSAMQLYGRSNRPPAGSRRLGEDSDPDCSRDSSSDGSSDCELERDMEYPRGQNRNHVISTSMPLMDGLSLSGKHVSLQEGFSSDDGESGEPLDCLLFEYLERTLPYSREPLSDKVLDLARGFPELRTFRSCDLSPSSWISVAWYPIYRIPTGLSMKDLDACFLTFHSLSTPMTDATAAAAAAGPAISYSQGVDGASKISLPVFGMASYKFKGSTWISTSGRERQLANSLLQDAGNRLRQLNVCHPDYQFFASNAAYDR